MYPYKTFTWTVDHARIAPRLGITLHQKWPYAPFYQMVAGLEKAGRDAALFLCLAALTLLILGEEPRLDRMALIAGLFVLSYWVLMSGGVPLPASVLPAQFAETQIKALPVLAILPLVLAWLVLRGHSWISKTQLLLLMALLILGHPLLVLVPDETKRRAIESTAQDGLVIYLALLALFAGIRAIVRRRVGSVQAHPIMRPPTEAGTEDEQND